MEWADPLANAGAEPEAPPLPDASALPAVAGAEGAGAGLRLPTAEQRRRLLEERRRAGDYVRSINEALSGLRPIEECDFTFEAKGRARRESLATLGDRNKRLQRALVKLMNRKLDEAMGAWKERVREAAVARHTLVRMMQRTPAGSFDQWLFFARKAKEAAAASEAEGDLESSGGRTPCASCSGGYATRRAARCCGPSCAGRRPRAARRSARAATPAPPASSASWTCCCGRRRRRTTRSRC